MVLCFSEAAFLLENSGLPKGVVEHCFAVSKRAEELGKKIIGNGHEVDLELVKTAALLHDIGKSRSFGLDHGEKTGEILRELGEDELAKTAERHCAGIFKNTLISEMSLEEKIVLYADRTVKHTSVCDLEERFRDIYERRKASGQADEGELIMSTFEKTRELEKQLFSLME